MTDVFDELKVPEEVKGALRSIKAEVDGAYKDSIEYQNKLLESAAELLYGIQDERETIWVNGQPSSSGPSMLSRLPELKKWYADRLKTKAEEKKSKRKSKSKKK